MDSVQLVKLGNLTPEQLQELITLFVQADFAGDDGDLQWLQDAVANSVAAVGALDENNSLIGFARALGDGVSDCYIQDVVVSKDHRRRGIGRKLVEFLLQELEARNIDWIGLIATPGNEEFYRSIGFEVLAEHTPMIKRR